jgi:hypothetical protein
VATTYVDLEVETLYSPAIVMMVLLGALCIVNLVMADLLVACSPIVCCALSVR